MRRLHNAADVDDAVQDIWLRAHERLADGDIANVAAYLFQTAHSVLADRARRAAVRHQQQHQPMEDHHHPVEGLTPERVLLGRETVRQVADCLGRMPERTRDIFVLHRFEQLSYSEIARNMGISVSAVEKHIMKALRLLLDQTR